MHEPRSLLLDVVQLTAFERQAHDEPELVREGHIVLSERHRRRLVDERHVGDVPPAHAQRHIEQRLDAEATHDAVVDAVVFIGVVERDRSGLAAGQGRE